MLLKYSVISLLISFETFNSSAQALLPGDFYSNCNYPLVWVLTQVSFYANCKFDYKVEGPEGPAPRQSGNGNFKLNKDTVVLEFEMVSQKYNDTLWMPSDTFKLVPLIIAPWKRPDIRMLMLDQSNLYILNRETTSSQDSCYNSLKRYPDFLKLPEPILELRKIQYPPIIATDENKKRKH